MTSREGGQRDEVSDEGRLGKGVGDPDFSKDCGLDWYGKETNFIPR